MGGECEMVAFILIYLCIHTKNFGYMLLLGLGDVFVSRGLVSFPERKYDIVP